MNSFNRLCKEWLQQVFYPIDFNEFALNINPICKNNRKLSVYLTPTQHTTPPSPKTPIVQNLNFEEAAKLIKEFGDPEIEYLAPKLTNTLLNHVEYYSLQGEFKIPIMNPEVFPESYPPPKLLSFEEYKAKLEEVLKKEEDAKNKKKSEEKKLGINKKKVIFKRKLNKSEVLSRVFLYCGEQTTSKRNLAYEKSLEIFKDYINQCIPNAYHTSFKLQSEKYDATSKVYEGLNKSYKLDDSYFDKANSYREAKSKQPKPLESLLFPKLPDDADYKFKHAINSNSQYVITDRITITSKDLCTLYGTTWLNDEIINSYCNLIQKRSDIFESNGSTFPKVHIFNTFFYKKLESRGRSAVAKWTKNVDIFKKDKVIIPINIGNMHWALACIDFTQKRIRYLDSLSYSKPDLFKNLKNYINEEYEAKYNAKFDWLHFTFEDSTAVPKQSNGYDCGVFLCTFANFLALDYPLQFNQSNINHFRLRIATELINAELM